MIIVPSPRIKFPRGNVPSIMPRLPNSVGTKFITDDAVPILSFASSKSISIANGREIDPMTVNGKKLSKNSIALNFPAVKTKIPLKIATKKYNFSM